jgi:hypothetical protein
MITSPNTHTSRSLLAAVLLASALISACAHTPNDPQQPRIQYSAGQDLAVQTQGEGELEQLLAPIALYPDTILSHILVASTYPLDVVQAERWATENPDVKGQDAVEASQENNWDPSVHALVAFPQLLKRMSQDLDWTQKLGAAFLQNEGQVLASIQNLRALAEQAGSLDQMENVTVTRDRPTIIIEPRERHVVYVPYYDTRVVYGDWRWQRYQPVFWDYPYAYGPYYDGFYAYDRRNSFYWGPATYLSFGFYSNAFHWRNHYLVRVPSRYYQPSRYYSHNDIIGHRHAQRWVHDQPHGADGRINDQLGRQVVAQRDSQTAGFRSVDQDVGQKQRSQTGQRVNQEYVRSRLESLRGSSVNTNTARRINTVPSASTLPRATGSASTPGWPANADSQPAVSQPQRQDVYRQTPGQARVPAPHVATEPSTQTNAQTQARPPSYQANSPNATSVPQRHAAIERSSTARPPEPNARANNRQPR